MKTALGLLGLLSMGALLLASTTGCEVACSEDEEKKGTVCVAKSLTRFSGTPATEEAAWSTGGEVNIESVFGHVLVKTGAADTVKVTFEPFSYRAYDGEVDAQRDMTDSLKWEVVPNGAGVNVRTWREGTHGSSLGAQMTVELPSNFDGKVIVHNHGEGNVATHNEFDAKVDFVGAAKELDVRVESDLGECRVTGAASVTKSEVHCGDYAELTGVSDFVNVSTKDSNVLDDAIRVSLASISAAGGGTITSADGTIVLTLPSGGVYSYRAQSAADGMVNVTAPPTARSTQLPTPPRP
jgi:hypothetical protein